MMQTHQHETYSDLQRALDEREALEAYHAQRARDAERMFTITQLGAMAFHHALGCQGTPTIGGDA